MLNNKKEGLFSYISFNQNNSCFVAIQNNKKVIINHSFPLMQPYVIIFEEEIKIIEMFYNSNILFIVGLSTDIKKKFSDKKIVIWNDYSSDQEGELNFKQIVENVKIRKCLSKNYLFVLLQGKIYIFTFPNFELESCLQTEAKPPHGIISFSNFIDRFYIAYLSKQIGTLEIYSLDKKYSTSIKAHDTKISNFSFNQNGELIASVSSFNSYIRVHNTQGENIYEFKTGFMEGINESQIFDLCFCANFLFIIDSFGVKVYELSERKQKIQENIPQEKKKNIFGKLFKSIKKIYKTEGSINSLFLAEYKSIITAVDDSKLIVIDIKGNYCELGFNPKIKNSLSKKIKNILNY